MRLIFPSEAAIDGLGRIGQMRARLGQARTDWLYLRLVRRDVFRLGGDRGARVLCDAAHMHRVDECTDAFAVLAVPTGA